ncbi:MAG: F0F1 ATP synthase subunit delta [Oscillospiraceae bacterium]|nr:F0F1 ATP synthase subunit delta [Oscillospiraceae bacterium]
MSGAVTARVVSAAALTVDQLAALTDLLTKKLNKPVEILAETDPAVIGGLYIHADGLVVDYTVKKRLNDMRDQLKRSKA